MSDSDTPRGGNAPRVLDELRRQAKHLLKQVRALDTVVIAQLRQLLPRLAKLDDPQIAERLKLADVQQAIARQHGHEHWRALKEEHEHNDPLQEQAARFLQALREDDTPRAVRLLATTPAIATLNIHTAAALGDVAAVQDFLAEDPTLATARDSAQGLAPLLYAVQEELERPPGVSSADQLTTVRALLDAGADPNASAPLPDRSEAIPALFFPCARGDAPLARLLLERGARPTDGESLYHAAQHHHEACLQVLLEFGADLSRGPAPTGNTPLHFLAAHTPDNRVTPSAIRGMQWLLEHGADPNVPSHAARADHPQAGETPLQRAAAVGHGSEVLRLLVTHGADVHLRRVDGATAYQLAVRAGSTEAAAFLASAGAATTLTPTDQLLGACMTGNGELAREVVSSTPTVLAQLDATNRDALGRAITRGALAVAELMISVGWPLTQEGEWGGTPLHWAAWYGRVDLVRRLLAAGAPVNVRDSRYGSSPIAWCAHGSRYCERGNDADYPAIVNLLLDAGATRPESYNRWSEAPETLARPSVVAAFKARSFSV